MSEGTNKIAPVFMLDHMNLEQFYFFLSILREQMEQFYLFRSILSGAVLYVRQHIEWSNLGLVPLL